MKTAGFAAALSVIGLALLLAAGASGKDQSAPCRPAIAGPWQTLFQPVRTGRYINDHCLFQDPKGDWHLVGITGKVPFIGLTEKYFAHAAGPSLQSPLAELDALFKGTPDQSQKWAPHAIWAGDTLHLFAGPGAIRHFTSRDGYRFDYVDSPVKNQYRWLRDTMVIKLGSGWIMYATDLVNGKDSISAFKSADLYTWEPAGVVLTALRPAPVWAPLPTSATESPFVISRPEGYYLSTTITNYPGDPRPGVYLNTVVFFSTDPLNFGVYAPGRAKNTAVVAAELETHAPEYVQDREGRWSITCSGWGGFPRPSGCKGGRLCIAPLNWVKH